MASPTVTLSEEHSTMAALTALLQQEQQCLVGADTEGLTALMAPKTQLVNQMAALASQRHQALAAAGLAPKDDAMDSWLATSGDTAACALWQQLLNLTRAGKELNRVNGMLINKQLSNNQTIINAMRTPTTGGDSGVYGPGGQAMAAGPSRRFVIG